MSLSPQDIQSKQFHVRFRGFDVEEVDAFLEQIAENYLMLQEENKTLKSQYETAARELEHLKSEESSFKSAIMSAQSVAEEMKKKSLQDADRIIDEAQAEVKQLKDEANREITELEYQVDTLKGMLTNLQNDLRAVIHTYLEQINNPDILTDGTIQPPLQGGRDHAAQEAYDETESLAADAGQLDDAEYNGEDEDEDLTDLYEKIDLGSDLPEDEEGDDIGSGPALSLADTVFPDENLVDEEDDDISPAAIPDLDDEVMFTLEDPLDEDDTSKG